MKLRWKGLLLAAFHLALVLGLGGKLLLDRATRPRFWLQAAPVDPNLPIRGRYVDLDVSVPVPGKELALDYRPREQWVEYLRNRKAPSVDSSRKRGNAFGPEYSWGPNAAIPQIRIELREKEAWGHLENAPMGTPGLVRRDPQSMAARIRSAVGIDLGDMQTEPPFPEPPQGLSEADLDPWLESLPPKKVALGDSLAFFIPEHVPDPSLRAAGEELWVEVTLPRKGPLRPIRLGVKKDGRLTALKLGQ